MINLGQMLEETCLNHGDKIFIIHDKARMTYDELNAAVNALAGHLQDLGVRRHDKIAIMLPNCPEFIISYFAAQKVGAVAVTLNVLSTSYELKHFLGNSDAVVFITLGNLAKRFEDIRAELPQCRHLITTMGMDSESPFTQILQNGPKTFVTPDDIRPEDPAVMIYTAGLMGKPLGAVLTHRNLLYQSELLKWMFGGNHRDRSMAIIPFFHSFGGVSNMLAVINVGASVVLMERFNLDTIFNVIEKEKVTYTAAVPRLYLGMYFHPTEDKYDISSLRFCVTGGAPMPADFI
ncbi:MAG: AMP-binding protein, partial [Syntrophales bacterium]|nr:AMP-binding protein [Syntrophales bacterium]